MQTNKYTAAEQAENISKLIAIRIPLRRSGGGFCIRAARSNSKNQ